MSLCVSVLSVHSSASSTSSEPVWFLFIFFSFCRHFNQFLNFSECVMAWLLMSIKHFTRYTLEYLFCYFHFCCFILLFCFTSLKLITATTVVHLLNYGPSEVCRYYTPTHSAQTANGEQQTAHRTLFVLIAFVPTALVF